MKNKKYINWLKLSIKKKKKSKHVFQWNIFMQNFNKIINKLNIQQTTYIHRLIIWIDNNSPKP